MEKLFERLGTENNLFNSFVSKEEMELYLEIQTLIRNVTDGDLQRIEEQIDIVQADEEYIRIGKTEFVLGKRGTRNTKIWQ